VRVEGPGRAGIGDDVRARFGDRVVEVRVLGDGARAAADVVRRQGRTPHELFDEYLAEQSIEDPRLSKLFSELLDAESNA
jgi:hypothetical protein